MGLHDRDWHWEERSRREKLHYNPKAFRWSKSESVAGLPFARTCRLKPITIVEEFLARGSSHGNGSSTPGSKLQRCSARSDSRLRSWQRRLLQRDRHSRARQGARQKVNLSRFVPRSIASDGLRIAAQLAFARHGNLASPLPHLVKKLGLSSSRRPGLGMVHSCRRAPCRIS